MLTSREKLSAAYMSRSSRALKTKEKRGHFTSAARLRDANRRSTKCQRACPAALVSALSRQSGREPGEKVGNGHWEVCVGGAARGAKQWGSGGDGG